MSYFEELDKEMDRYLEDNASEEPVILKKLRKETYQKTTQPHMISGYLQGRLLNILSHIVQPKHVLEIGTFTGYAALSIAEGLPKDGKIYTIDKMKIWLTFLKNILQKVIIKTKSNSSSVMRKKKSKNWIKFGI